MDNNKKLKENLKTEGFSTEEIEDVMEGLKDIKTGKVYTAEEVYKYLFKKEVKHA